MWLLLIVLSKWFVLLCSACSFHIKLLLFHINFVNTFEYVQSIGLIQWVYVSNACFFLLFFFKILFYCTSKQGVLPGQPIITAGVAAPKPALWADAVFCCCPQWSSEPFCLKHPFCPWQALEHAWSFCVIWQSLFSNFSGVFALQLKWLAAWMSSGVRTLGGASPHAGNVTVKMTVEIAQMNPKKNAVWYVFESPTHW